MNASTISSVSQFDSRPRRVSRRAQLELRLNRQWRQQRRTLAILGGALAFLCGLLWPSRAPQHSVAKAPQHSARWAANSAPIPH